jgi:hypothetical protein
MSNMTTIDILSVQQKERLHELEATIDKGIKTFVEVGKALAEIQDNKLYLEKYTTFEAYSEARFGLKRATAYQYIAAAAVAENVAEVSEQKPTISQTRPLVGLEPEEQKKVWKSVVEESSATDKPITERQVKEKVSAIADNGTGLGMGKIHKITPRVAAEPVPSLPETEEIAELRQRPTQLEYQILQGELEQLKQQKVTPKHRYLTGTILEEVIADMCYYGKTYTDKSRLIADVGNEMRNRNITAMTTNMISFVNDFLKKQNYPRFDIAEDGSLEYRKELYTHNPNTNQQFYLVVPGTSGGNSSNKLQEDVRTNMSDEFKNVMITDVDGFLNRIELLMDEFNAKHSKCKPLKMYSNTNEDNVYYCGIWDSNFFRIGFNIYKVLKTA